MLFVPLLILFLNPNILILIYWVITLLCEPLFSKFLSVIITLFPNSALSTLLQIDQDYISLEQSFLGWYIQRIKIPKSDIISVGFKRIMRYKFSNILIIYSLKNYQNEDKNKRFRFGAFLTQQEKEWLVWEIRNHL